MKYTVLTLFPEIVEAYFANSIMAKAVSRGIVEYRAVNIRDYALDRHHTCDDAPYGGGAGMLMLAEPLGRALEAAGAGRQDASAERAGEPGLGNDTGGEKPPNSSDDTGEEKPPGAVDDTDDTVGAETAAGPGGRQSETAGVSREKAKNARVIYLSPSGRPFDQNLARELAAEKELILLCGRYEGIDQRIIDMYVDDEISTGDYVLSSGEVAALILIDATYRLLDEVITPASLEEESFSGGLLEYPQYTRPEIYDTLKVPEVLLSGHHENIRRWRLEKRVEKTLALRPDLIRLGEEKGLFDAETRKIIEEKRRENAARGNDERD